MNDNDNERNSSNSYAPSETESTRYETNVGGVNDTEQYYANGIVEGTAN